jgi:hypothetical protein
MPSKTKNRRAKRSNRGKTRSQRGGDIWHTLSLGLAGTPDDPNTASSTSWWNPFKSDPNGKSWWDKLTSPNTTTTTPAYDSSDVENPMQKSYVPDASSAPSAPIPFDPSASAASESSLSNDSFSTKYGGKRSKSRKCHRKHKHRKSCNK